MIGRSPIPRSSIVVLLYPRRPAAIAWFVVAVVIDAIKGKAGRLLTHVGEKVFEAVAPAIANLDAATAVVFEFLDPRIVAPRFHVGPSAECGTRRKAVRNALLSSSFAFEATARLGVTTAQIACADGHLDTASATTSPMNDDNAGRTSVAVGDTENGQAAELLTCDIVQFGHRAAPTVRRSSGGQTLQGLAVALSL